MIHNCTLKNIGNDMLKVVAILFTPKKNKLWLTSVILITQEAVIMAIVVRSQPGHETLLEKILHIKKGW
jgi:hypothetical protein